MEGMLALGICLSMLVIALVGFALLMYASAKVIQVSPCEHGYWIDEDCPHCTR